MRRVIGELPRERHGEGKMGPDCSASCGGWKGDVGRGGSALKPEGCQGSTRDDGRPDEVMMVVV